jgi:hypothetical protein
VKILFLIGATSRIRNFRDSILELAEKGHSITLAGRLRKGSFDLPAGIEHPRISGRVNPTERGDAWAEFVDLLRGARDYVRYFDPRYGNATRLVRRAYEIAPTDFVLFCERHPWMKRQWARVAQVLALCEELIPVDERFEAFVKEEAPDLVLVTPLVTFESYQTDYLKVANRLGIPVAFIPFSWDNLTNKGLVRVQPDRVLVWNEIQRNEAVELHGCSPAEVAVTGAARFDDFFARRPSTSRHDFLTAMGLDASRPMILYLGSSQLTGPNEMELIRRWMEAIRASGDERLRGAGILLRPHPALRNSYESLDYSDLGHVAVSLEASRNADQELFDSLFHAHAAVGLNTSAMLEAAIVGRPVHTLVVPGFDEGQVGTMHFHYLVEAYGGLATMARSIDEHLRQLAPVLEGDPAVVPRSRTFAEQFLRPHGIDRPVGPILTSEIERAGGISKRPAPPSPAWHGPARRLLLAWLQRRGGRRVQSADTTVIATSMSLRPVRTALEEIQQGTEPVFVGPWNDFSGSEVLYWIPFVRWVAEAYGLPPERLIVLSRDNVGEWYGALAHRYLDVRTLFSAQEFEHWLHRTVPQSEQNPKLAKMSPFDTEILERATRAFDLSDYQVLHPSMIFRVLRRLYQDAADESLKEVVRYPPVQPSSRAAIAGLPESFIAVSTALTAALPESDENIALLARILDEAAAAGPVVVVDGPGAGAVPISDSPRVFPLAGLLDGKVPVDLQAKVLSNAREFHGPLGDLAILAASRGVPAVAYHSERVPRNLAVHLQYTSAAAGWAPISIERARRFKGLRPVVKVRA